MTDTSTSANLASVVTEAVADALGLDEPEVTLDSSLIDDLGAESIDLLDILFRIERKSGVKVQASDIAERIQGGIPDEEFGDADEIITAKGLAHLQVVMPQIDVAYLTGTLRADQVMSLFTVRNLVSLVEMRANTAGDTA